MRRALESLAFGFAVLAGAAVFGMMALVAADVSFRFFQSGIHGTTEIVENYFMLMAGFLPMAYVERRDGMISVDAVFQALGAARRWVYGFATLFSAVVYAGLTYGTTLLAWKRVASQAYLDVYAYHLPIWPGWAMVPLALALTTVMALLRFADIVSGTVTLPPDGALEAETQP